MKKLFCLMVTLALLLASVYGLADIAGASVADGTAARNITIQKAGENSAEAGVSPTTGRTRSEVAVPEGFMGMAADGKYLPLMVQVTNSGSGLGNRAPWYASYADVTYEGAKTKNGVTRYTMVFSDTIPDWVGCVRSVRVQHVWLMAEWNVPFLYHGHQAIDGNTTGTDVSTAIRDLGYHVPEAPQSAGASLFYDGVTGAKAWNNYEYRVDEMGGVTDSAVYDAAGIMKDVVSQETFTPKNHAFRFSATLPEGGDDAGVVYVLWNKNNDKTGEENSPYYFNSLLEYEPSEGVYYRYIMKDRNNPNLNNLVPLEEMAPTNIKKIGGGKVSCSLTHGNQVAYSNVIVQFIETTWVEPSNEMPLATLTGSGNADYFMGGKHYSGVWNRDTLDDRTVFYDGNGQEISLQPGKTLIIMMDANMDVREIRYE